MGVIISKTLFPFLLLLTINLLGYEYYEVPFNKLTPEQQAIHLSMMKNDFNSLRGRNPTSNQFTVKIMLDNTNVLAKNVVTSSTENLTEQTCIETLKKLSKCIDGTKIQDFIEPVITSAAPSDKIKTYIRNHPNLRITDSEFKFFATFNSLKFSNLTAGNKITRIEIHGFTTRDMCPCCFTHMGLFYDRLKEALNGPASVNENSLFYNFIQQINSFLPQDTQVQLAFYISSSIQLGLQEFAGSIYPSYVGTTYNNSVKNITKFYPQNEQFPNGEVLEGESPTEGIFCTFIRDDNPNWSLQYYVPAQQKEWQPKNIPFTNNASTLSEEIAKYIKCSLNKGQTNCSFCNHNGKLKCSIHSKGRVTPEKYTITIPTSDIINDGTFRNLISPWITQEVFSFAKAEANTITIKDSPLSIE